MKLSELKELLQQDIENPDHPSDFSAQGDVSVLILRLPEVKEHYVDIVSYAFVTQKDRCYIFDRKKHDLVELGSLVELDAFLDKKTQELVKAIKRYHAYIEELEDSLYDGHLSEEFMQKWLTYKKEVSLIRRLMFHALLSFDSS